MGHTQCGGIQALMQHEEKKSSDHACIHQWLQSAIPAREQVMAASHNASFADVCQQAECASVALSLKHLQGYPWVQAAAERISLHGWVFDIASGMMKVFEHETQAFVPLDCSE